MKRIASFICGIFTAIFAFFSGSVPAARSVFADGESLLLSSYEQRGVLDDLQDMSLKGAAFNLENYTFNSYEKTQLLTLVELGYSYYTANDENYGLYLYLYNPQKLDIIAEHEQNAVSLAVGTGTDAPFNKYPLRYVNTSDGVRAGMFYKYRIDFSAAERTAVLDRLLADGRVYNVAEIELYNRASGEVETHNVSMTYTYTGYAKGFDEDAEAESTLAYTTNGLDTITPTVKQTNYRTGDYKDRVCDEVNTVYFSVPERYFEAYGNLQKIKAEWYEYKTDYIVVTADQTGYDELMNGWGINADGDEVEGAVDTWIGKDIGEYSDKLLWTIRAEQEWITDKYAEIYWVYNAYRYKSGQMDYTENTHYQTALNWLFFRDGTDAVDEYNVSAADILAYMEWYTETFAYDGQELIAGKYDARLFADSIDEDRVKYLDDQTAKRGKITKETDKDNAENLLTKVDKSWWDEFWHGASYANAQYSPIEVIDEKTFAGFESARPGMTESDKAIEFAEQYYLNPNDAQEIYDVVQENVSKNERTVFFHFAKTDYYASVGALDYTANTAYSPNDTYVAQMSMFLDFDLISLTFRLNSQDTVIGVVANPMDIINGVEAPPNYDGGASWWEQLWNKIKWYVIGVAAIILLIVLFPLWVLVFKFLVWLVTLLLKIIALPFIWLGKGIVKLFRRG